MPNARLARLLEDHRTRTPEWQPLYDDVVATLRALGVGASAPKVGELFPEFAIVDSAGRLTSLAELLAPGPLVLSFNRGGWCPFCRTELESWDHELPRG